MMCCRSVVKGPIDIPPPVKTPTPYGGVLVWTMPGQTKMYVHLKNKNLIRHRKRWSQVSALPAGSTPPAVIISVRENLAWKGEVCVNSVMSRAVRDSSARRVPWSDQCNVPHRLSHEEENRTPKKWRREGDIVPKQFSLI